MSLPYDVTRCGGAWAGATCAKRETCQRYIERNNLGERTPFNGCLCPGLDDFYQFHIPAEVAE